LLLTFAAARAKKIKATSSEFLRRILLARPLLINTFGAVDQISESIFMACNISQVSCILDLLAGNIGKWTLPKKNKNNNVVQKIICIGVKLNL